MIGVYLVHVRPAENMARFYSMSVQATLFGEWSLVREWGRIGRGGQVKASSFDTETAAVAELERLRRQKIRRGYMASGH